MKRDLIKLITLTALLSTSLSSFANDAVSLDDLLENVKAGQVLDRKAAAEREKRFNVDKNTQQQLLNQTKNERAREEKLSTQLEAQFDKNDKELNNLRLELAEELGDLKELMGVIQQTTGEAKVNFENSMVSAQIAGRAQQLGELAVKMGQSDALISMTDIENVWYQLQREMTEQGKVARFNAPVANVAGESREAQVVRVGVFNAVADGKFLQFSEATGLSELSRQPQGRFLSQAKKLETAQDGLVSFPIDPTQGQLLGALVASPTIMERIDQGGTVGYLIIALGVVALLIAVYKIVTLMGVEGKVAKQMKNLSNAATDNPLGRILNVYQKNPNSDVESMELKLGEAILKETPKLNAWLMSLKIISVVAPLMGLLGTVTGMIVTFQSITLFGAGDPKLMAGGISQALVTTVLGLCVAIPTVLLHTAASSRAKRLQEVLEEQSAGMIARQVEKLAA